MISKWHNKDFRPSCLGSEPAFVLLWLPRAIVIGLCLTLANSVPSWFQRCWLCTLMLAICLCLDSSLRDTSYFLPPIHMDTGCIGMVPLAMSLIVLHMVMALLLEQAWNLPHQTVPWIPALGSAFCCESSRVFQTVHGYVYHLGIICVAAVVFIKATGIRGITILRTINISVRGHSGFLIYYGAYLRTNRKRTFKLGLVALLHCLQ